MVTSQSKTSADEEIIQSGKVFLATAINNPNSKLALVQFFAKNKCLSVLLVFICQYSFQYFERQSANYLESTFLSRTCEKRMCASDNHSNGGLITRYQISFAVLEIGIVPLYIVYFSEFLENLANLWSFCVGVFHFLQTSGVGDKRHMI